MQRHGVAPNMARFALGLMLLTLLTSNTAAAFQHQRDSHALHRRHAVLYARQSDEAPSSDPPGGTTPTDPPTPTTSDPPTPTQPPPTDTTPPPPPPPPPGGSTSEPDPTDTNTSSTPDPTNSTPSGSQATNTNTGRSNTNTNTQTANNPANTGTRTPLTATPGTNTRTSKPTGSGSETDGGPSAEETGSSGGSGNILDNKSAAAGIFSVVGIAAAALLAAIGAWAYRKHQAARRAREADDDFGFGDDGSMRELNLRDSTPMPSGMEGAGAGAAAAAGAPLGRSATQSTARRGGASSHGHESEDYYNGPRGPLQVVTARESSFDLIPPSSLGSAYDPGNSNPFKRDSAQPGMAGRGAPAATEAYAHGYSAADYAQHYAQQDSHQQQHWQDGQRAGYEGNFNYDAGDYNPYQNQQQQPQQYSRPPYTGAASQNPFVQAEATAIARGGAETNTDSVYGGQAITTDSVYYDSAVPLPSATGTDYHSAVSHPGSVTPTQASTGGPGASSASLAQKPGMLPAIDFDNSNTATFDDAYGDDLQTPKTPRTGAALLGPLRPASPDSFYGATPRGSMLPSPRE